MSETVWIVVPARYASQRFPGKPLAELHGRPMIAWVLAACRRSRRADRVVVATDDKRIAAAVAAEGGRVEMTSAGHASGTERLAEIAHRYPEVDWFVNVQGDEPGIDPGLIDRLIEALAAAGDPDLVVSAAAPLKKPEDYHSPHVVKVVFDHHHRALYFSRSPIPFFRDRPELAEGSLPTGDGAWQHLGIYGYSGRFLRNLETLSPGRLAAFEKLEQLAWLENGYAIRIIECSSAWPGIDTPGELAAFAAAWPGRDDFGGGLNE
jgi:3-deoxy-manno-octulosonate cytidylyltransferase (CMP-KDO synthetase)